MTPNSWLCCLAFCTSAVAFAQAPKATVMPFPLEFKRTPSGFSTEDREVMQREYTRLLRIAGAQVPDFAHYDLALAELKRQDCEREDECLAQLAKKAEALYALYANVDYTMEGAVVVSGRVLRDDGKVASATQTVTLAKGRDPFKDLAKNALVQLFAQLKVGELAATRPVEAARVEPVKDLVMIGPPPPAPPMIQEDTGAGQRSLGKGVLYGGAGVAVVGAALAGIGAGLGYTAQRTGDSAASADAARQLATGRTLTTMGFVGLGVGAVAAGVGAVLLGTAAPAPVAQVSVVPTNGGGVVQFGGRF